MAMDYVAIIANGRGPMAMPMDAMDVIAAQIAPLAFFVFMAIILSLLGYTRGTVCVFFFVFFGGLSDTTKTLQEIKFSATYVPPPMVGRF